MTEGHWIELADRVYARRYPELDLTVGLVVGEDACLVIDTRGDAVQGAELAAAVRELTPHPWTLAITHAHFDHSFGTIAFGPCEVWAHRGCRATLADDGARTKEARASSYRRDGREADAANILGTELVLPGNLVGERAGLTIGGRRITLAHFGSAHSDHDLVVHLPDDSVTFAGDLVEHVPGGSLSADSFGPDTDLAGWPVALDGVLGLGASIVVPGHGDPVDAEFVAAQAQALRELTALDRAVTSGALDRTEAVRRSPLPDDVTLAMLDRRPSE